MSKIARWKILWCVVGGGILAVLIVVTAALQQHGKAGTSKLHRESGTSPISLSNSSIQPYRAVTDAVSVTEIKKDAPASNPINTDDGQAVASFTPSSLQTDPQEVYAALYSPDPDKRLRALDLVLQSVDTFYAVDNINSRIVELIEDDDPRIRDLAQTVLVNVMEIQVMMEAQTDFTAQDRITAEKYIAQSTAEERLPEWRPEEDTTDYTDVDKVNSDADSSIFTETYFNQIREAALRDPDPTVRGQAIEEALIYHDKRIIDLLSEAVRYDVDNDNRMIARDALLKMLEEGFGDANRIIGILQESSDAEQ